MFSKNVKGITLLSGYKGMRSKVKLRCHTCSYEWSANAYYVLRGVGCPQCRESKGEKTIRHLLESSNIEYIREFTPSWCEINRYRYDFYIPKYNMMIEFDGKQHFMEFTGNVFKSTSSLEDRIKIDLDKDLLCINNGTKLLRISFSELKNIEDILIKGILKLYKSENNILKIGNEYIR